MRISTVDRRQQLIDAAIRVIRRDGVESASLRTIASEAKASLAAVHVCFTNKDELMQAAAAELLQQLVRSIPRVVDGSEDVRAIAHRVMDLFWAQMVSDQLNILAQFEIGIWAKRNPHHGDLSRIVYSDYEKEISKLLIAAAERQKQTIAARDVARALIVIMDGCSLQYFADPSDPRHKDLCDSLVDAYLDRVGL